MIFYAKYAVISWVGAVRLKLMDCLREKFIDSTRLIAALLHKYYRVSSTAKSIKIAFQAIIVASNYFNLLSGLRLI